MYCPFHTSTENVLLDLFGDVFNVKVCFKKSQVSICKPCFERSKMLKWSPERD